MNTPVEICAGETEDPPGMHSGRAVEPRGPGFWNHNAAAFGLIAVLLIGGCDILGAEEVAGVDRPEVRALFGNSVWRLSYDESGWENHTLGGGETPSWMDHPARHLELKVRAAREDRVERLAFFDPERSTGGHDPIWVEAAYFPVHVLTDLLAPDVGSSDGWGTESWKPYEWETDGIELVVAPGVVPPGSIGNYPNSSRSIDPETVDNYDSYAVALSNHTEKDSRCGDDWCPYGNGCSICWPEVPPYFTFLGTLDRGGSVVKGVLTEGYGMWTSRQVVAELRREDP